jgi:hypothetical protein
MGDETRISRAEWRRRRGRAIGLRQQTLAERDAFLDSQLEPGEPVLARSRDHPLVTDRRILDATRRRLPPRRGEWMADTIPFEVISAWSLGELHDHRPILDLEHAPSATVEVGPAKRFLWFRWGIAEQSVMRTSHRLGFGKATDPVLVAILAELARRGISQRPSFVIRPAGTRADRMRTSRGGLYRTGWFRLLSWRIASWRIADVVYRGRLAWPLRLLGWVLVGIPVWFIGPWLVVPALLATEVVWILIMQWSWIRDRARQRRRI